MRGPLLFLLSLAAAAAAVVLLLVPAIEEREALRAELAAADAATDQPVEPLGEVGRELAERAGPIETPGAMERIRGMAAAFSPVPPVERAGQTVLVGEWDRLPRLLAALEEIAGVLRSVRVEPDGEDVRCRVTIRCGEIER